MCDLKHNEIMVSTKHGNFTHMIYKICNTLTMRASASKLTLSAKESASVLETLTIKDIVIVGIASLSAVQLL